MQNGHFPSKSAFHLKKVCYKVSFCEYCHWQSCTTFAGLSNCAEMVGGGHPIVHENLAETDPPPSKMMISNQYSHIVPQP